MGSESDVATHWKTHLIIGKNFSNPTVYLPTNLIQYRKLMEHTLPENAAGIWLQYFIVSIMPSFYKLIKMWKKW